MRSPDAMERNSRLKKRPMDSIGITIMLMYCVKVSITPRLIASCTTSPPPNHKTHTVAIVARLMLNVSNTTS